MPLNRIKALTFDVFGTVVDWRGSIVVEGAHMNRERGWNVDWAAFADAWRALYQPSMSEVRDGKRPWVRLDDLHRESLETLIPQYGLEDLDTAEREQLNCVWHRLQPWPDAVAGLMRLKRKFVLATLSNGNIALLVNMAKHAKLPWDAILGAEVARHYKRQPEAYLITAELLGLQPDQCLMVAAHNDDLVTAAGLGFRTAFVARPTEYGPAQTTDLRAEHEFDIIADDFNALATTLGC
ncbi:MAG: haloacid dehalogenase type II [Gammaproteobacteria bacterium]|nr:haloacid dehalogenase type II [Gammaproteobacteria bacterium]